MKKGCYWDALSYEFDEDGNTVKVCKLKRKICPSFGGKCPAIVLKEVIKMESKKLCSECGRPLDLRGKCHECLNDQFLNEEYDAYSEMNKDGE